MSAEQDWASGPGISFIKPTLLYLVGLISALVGLFLPIIGPVLDHHFAERQHNHAHLYLAAGTTEHSHFYEHSHSHSHAHKEPNNPSSNLAIQDPGVADIVYLITNDGVGHSVASLAATTLHVNVVYPALGDDQLLAAFFRLDTRPPEAFVPPPDTPPKI